VPSAHETLAELGTGAMETRLHRRLGEAEGARCFLPGEPLEVAQDEDLAMHRIQVSDGGVDGVDEPPLLEGRLRTERRRRDVVELVHAFTQCPPLTREGAQKPEAGLAHDREQPREHARIARDVGTSGELPESFLHRVVGVIIIAAHSPTKAVDAVVVGANEKGERVIVSARGGFEELLVTVAHRSRHVETPMSR
jgi:hypothetical protein